MALILITGFIASCYFLGIIPTIALMLAIRIVMFIALERHD